MRRPVTTFYWYKWGERAEVSRTDGITTAVLSATLHMDAFTTMYFRGAIAERLAIKIASLESGTADPRIV